MKDKSEIPGSEEFTVETLEYLGAMARDENLRKQAVALQIAADSYKLTYLQTFCGVPIIRLPDDIHTFHEAVWAERPSFIIETGIARGGSLVMSAAFMKLASIEPKVLGLDIQILDHTTEALRNSPFAAEISTWEGDSGSAEAAEVVARFIAESSVEANSRGFLVLDSDHTEKHVFRELEVLAPLLPLGSLVFVADTLIEEFPAGYYENRSWDVGDNPMTALKKFLESNHSFERAHQWSRRGLLTEFRDGVIRRVG